MLIALRGALNLELLADRAIWLPATQSLLLADLHMGKAQSFRNQGLPVPAGTTEVTLARLENLVRAWPVHELIILGDFLHDRHAQRSDALRQFAAWRTRHPALAIHLVRGNHDKHAGDPPPECGLAVHTSAIKRAGLLLCHEPAEHTGSFVVAGHIHPVVWLAGAVDRLRLPCFWLREDSLILPAFGEFTGGWPVEPAPTDRLFASDGERVHEIPALHAVRRRRRGH